MLRSSYLNVAVKVAIRTNLSQSLKQAHACPGTSRKITAVFAVSPGLPLTALSSF